MRVLTVAYGSVASESRLARARHGSSRFIGASSVLTAWLVLRALIDLEKRNKFHG